jgi:DNA-directed RNA polymerase specialized sigma24 family protein
MQVEGDETEPPSEDGDRLSVAEIRGSIDALSDMDTARLMAAAQGFSRLCGIDAEDLLQEALTRALEGRRTCGRETALVPFICGIMKSFASQENEARKEGFRPTVVLRDGEPIVPEVPADDPSPERAAISAIDGRPVLAEIEAAAAGDEKLQLLIEGIYDGMRGAELQGLLGVDEKGLTPDADIIAEIGQSGIERARTILMEVKASTSRHALARARAQLETWRAAQSYGRHSLDRTAARDLFGKLRNADPAFNQKLMMAARNSSAPTDRDKDGLIEDWADLQRLDKQDTPE